MAKKKRRKRRNTAAAPKPMMPTSARNRLKILDADVAFEKKEIAELKVLVRDMGRQALASAKLRLHCRAHAKGIYKATKGIAALIKKVDGRTVDLDNLAYDAEDASIDMKLFYQKLEEQFRRWVRYYNKIIKSLQKESKEFAETAKAIRAKYRK